ncbi:zinc ribbon domain-containing protein [Massilia alkalitolerans]|uniref:zinc ribbon domain-containing protein n=1 Tax=Massilia alkalitolerans TaxID=286638 RepID=UPI0028AD6114|nr:zinc ribbon domain-containing protein [Massilia alkalitolerans]
MKDGMVQDDAVYRCIGPHCGRLMPRRVNFCPWCGTAQQAVQPVTPVLAKAPAAAPTAAPLPAPTIVPTPAPTAPPPLPAAGPAPAAAAGAAAQQSQRQGPAQPPPQPQPGRGIPPPPGVGRAAPAGPTPAQPPRRAPIRLRWWIAALAALWLIWVMVRPEGSRIERRMDRAVALAVECKARDAQDELIALRSTRATPEQLRQVQQSLNKAAADCTRAEQRARAWLDTTGAIKKLRRARAYDKALARLAVFTKRWGEDDQTRALRLEIVDEREHPLADPSRNE